MIVFPNCKINLGLRVVRKRSDGYHDLETVFYPLPLYDILEVTASSALSFTTSGLPIEGNTADNLCMKAYQSFLLDYKLPAVKIHLHKTIPMGAGLGGGSSDAAFMLDLINTMYDIRLPANKLFGYALELGSDCPFFLINKPRFATSRGEVMKPVQLDLTGYQFVLVYPGIHINTGSMFQHIHPAAPAKSIQYIIEQPIDTWKEELINDFEKPVFLQYPGIQAIKEELYSKGAVYASMSGSGSAVYGIFKKGGLPPLSFPSHYFVKQLIGKF